MLTFMTSTGVVKSKKPATLYSFIIAPIWALVGLQLRYTGPQRARISCQNDAKYWPVFSVRIYVVSSRSRTDWPLPIDGNNTNTFISARKLFLLNPLNRVVPFREIKSTRSCEMSFKCGPGIKNTSRNIQGEYKGWVPKSYRSLGDSSGLFKAWLHNTTMPRASRLADMRISATLAVFPLRSSKGDKSSTNSGYKTVFSSIH